MCAYRIIKRGIDLFISIVLLIPVMLICSISALFIILETKGKSFVHPRKSWIKRKKI